MQTQLSGTCQNAPKRIDAPETDQVCIDASDKDRRCGIDAREEFRAFAPSNTLSVRAALLTGMAVLRAIGSGLGGL
jgi:hypothetical protein